MGRITDSLAQGRRRAAQVCTDRGGSGHRQNAAGGGPAPPGSAAGDRYRQGALLRRRGGLAYAPVVQWLRTEDLREGLSTLDDVWLTEVARLMPELLVEQPDLAPPGPLTESWQRQRLFEALARAVLGGGQPLLLLDDLQWGDRETLEWLHYLLRFDRRARLLIVGAVRPEETGGEHPLGWLVPELRRRGQPVEIGLGRLDEARRRSWRGTWPAGTWPRRRRRVCIRRPKATCCLWWRRSEQD